MNTLTPHQTFWLFRLQKAPEGELADMPYATAISLVKQGLVERALHSTEDGPVWRITGRGRHALLPYYRQPRFTREELGEIAHLLAYSNTQAAVSALKKLKKSRVDPEQSILGYVPMRERNEG